MAKKIMVLVLLILLTSGVSIFKNPSASQATENVSDAILDNDKHLEIKKNILLQDKNRSFEIPQKLLSRKLQKRDSLLAVTPEAIQQKIHKCQKMFFVDIRNSKDFEKFHIPGSLNVPLFTIKTKPFLKSRPLILLNEGYSYSRLEEECKKLRDLGFQASILNGGLYGWKQKDMPVVGDVFAQRVLNKIPPHLFFEEKDYDDWIIINIFQSKETLSRYLFPSEFHIPFTDKAEEFILRLQTIRAQYSKEKDILPNSFRYLIIDDDGQHYEKVEKYIQKAGIKNIFYLQGGLQAYSKFLIHQAIIWQKKDKAGSGKVVRGCSSCP